MDLLQTLVSTLISAAAATAAVHWLVKKAVEHGLARDLESVKADRIKEIEETKAKLAETLASHQLILNQNLEMTKAELQRSLAFDTAHINGAVRKEIENQLGEATAQRQYETEARRRLYLALGPLRFQLLMSCRDLAARIESMGKKETYDTSLNRYYGLSTCYRILRPIAISELIEEQIALADFSVDPTAIDCLRFRRTLTRILSGDELVGDHPNANWKQQTEHVYADSLSSCSNVLIDRTDGGRVLRFQEFSELIAKRGEQIVSPFDVLLRDFSIRGKPILWMRLVAQANACNQFINRSPNEVFERLEMPIENLLRLSNDRWICDSIEDRVKLVKSVELVSL